jgi:hypothetical protein
MAILAKETITIGPPARCARHDITLPGHPRTNVITPGNMSQSSYLTEIQIWLVSGYLRLRMPEKKRCNTNWWDDIVRFLGNELWKWVPKQEFIIKPRSGWGGGWLTQRQFIKISKRMDFHNYANKEITFVKSNDIMLYARGKHTPLIIGWKVRPKDDHRQHDQC